MDGWLLAFPLLTSGGLAGAQSAPCERDVRRAVSSVGAEASERQRLATAASSAAAGAAGTTVGAEGRACGSEACVKVIEFSVAARRAEAARSHV